VTGWCWRWMVWREELGSVDVGVDVVVDVDADGDIEG